MNLLKDMTWTCHVCGDERTDAKISVAKYKGKRGKLAYGIPVGYNVRFCNDRPECEAGTRAVAEGWAARIGGVIE